jgi:integrase
VSLLLNWKPRSFYDRRLHLLILLLFDCGLRISEALNIRVRDADLDAMLLLIDGKGAKPRRVPFSYELRKSLYRYVKDYDRKPEDWLLADKGGKKTLGRCVMLRNVKELCRKLGFEPPVRTIHAMRHTFGANYIRRGGSVYHQQACLGHTALGMSRRYSNLNVADLQAKHESISLVRRLG